METKNNKKKKSIESNLNVFLWRVLSFVRGIRPPLMSLSRTDENNPIGGGGGLHRWMYLNMMSPWLCIYPSLVE